MKKLKEKRKYVARPGIEPRTPDLRVSCPTDCATRPGTRRAKNVAYYFIGNYTFTITCSITKQLKSEEIGDRCHDNKFSTNLYIKYENIKYENIKYESEHLKKTCCFKKNLYPPLKEFQFSISLIIEKLNENGSALQTLHAPQTRT